jgi:hypothetical protein
MSGILLGKPILHSEGNRPNLSNATGTLPVANGGTGKTSLADNRVLTGNGTGAVSDEANLTFNGTTLAVTGAATISTTLGVSGISSFTSSTNSTSISTGAVVITGGLGVGGNFYGINAQLSSTGNVSFSGRAVMQGGTLPSMQFLNSGFSARIPLDCAGLILDKTITAGGTTGAQTINKYAGSVNFAAAATSLVVTNSLLTANSLVVPFIQTNDATMTEVRAVPAAGSFTLHTTTAPTAETRVGFHVIN